MGFPCMKNLAGFNFFKFFKRLCCRTLTCLRFNNMSIVGIICVDSGKIKKIKNDEFYNITKHRKVANSLASMWNVHALTLWRPLLPHWYTAVKHPVPDRVKSSCVIFNIRALWRSGTPTLSAERQSAWMSNITNNGLTRTGTGRFIPVPMATVAVKGLSSRQAWFRLCYVADGPVFSRKEFIRPLAVA